MCVGGAGTISVLPLGRDICRVLALAKVWRDQLGHLKHRHLLHTEHLRFARGGCFGRREGQLCASPTEGKEATVST